MLGRRSALMAAAAVAAVFAFYPKVTEMSSTRSNLREIRRLLGSAGEAIASDDASIAAWAPDANYKPQRYHLLRKMDEAAFRALAQQAGLAVQPSPEASEAIWRLPAGMALTGWTADKVPPGAALQASGGVGEAVAWMRWHQGQLFVVVLPAA
jgi:hypothetical protein